jgi:HEAT repeat protein
LARLAGKSPRAFDLLMESTRSSDALVRTTAAYWAARTVEAGGERTTRIRARLEQMLSDPDANVRATATNALGSLASRG